jgi:hypothetical protein
MTEPVENDRNPSEPSPAEPAHDLRGLAVPRPVNPPPPTVWPFVTSVGLMIGFWGVVLNLLVVSVGAGVFLVGMAGLVGDWVREHRNQSI